MAKTGTARDPEGERWQVFFAADHSDAEIPSGSVLITPKGDWNDFEYHTRVQYRIRSRLDDSVYRASGAIGFRNLEEGAENGVDHLRKIVGGSSNGRVRATSEHHFFTMLPSMQAYRDLVQRMDADQAAEVLQAVNDLVAVNEFNPTESWIDEAVRLPVFTLSFIRESEAFFAYKNAGFVLRGLSMERLGGFSESLRIHFRLAGRENEHNLRFDFKHQDVLPRRISVIIGKNGVGKSQTLGRIVRAALNDDSALTDGETGGRPVINRILAFAPTNEAETVFPPERRKSPRIWYRRLSLNRARRSRRNESVCDLIVQLARSVEFIQDRSRWEIFLSALEAIDSSDQLCLPSLTEAPGYIALSKLRLGSEQRLLERFAGLDTGREVVRLIDGKGYPLSSGEISFLKFVAQASLHIENGSLLLIDEPETHLHPNFVSRFVALLDGLLEQTGSAAIVATHSVYFVREVFREQVTVLRLDASGWIEASTPTLRTFGADVGAISYFVFGEDEPSTLAARVQDKLLQQSLPWSELYARYRDELSPEFLSRLKAAMQGDKGIV